MTSNGSNEFPVRLQVGEEITSIRVQCARAHVGRCERDLELEIETEKARELLTTVAREAGDAVFRGLGAVLSSRVKLEPGQEMTFDLGKTYRALREAGARGDPPLLLCGECFADAVTELDGPEEMARLWRSMRGIE